MVSVITSRNLLLGLLVFIFLIFGIVVCEAKFGGGSGTTGNPYFIETREQLENVRHYLSSHFRQVTDISLADSEWEPIGNEEQPFTGFYDGNRFILSDMRISGISNAGLFGFVKEGSLANIRLQNIKMQNVGTNTGGLVGALHSSRPKRRSDINNCYVTGSITADANSVGGLIGFVSYAQLTDSWSDVEILSEKGIIGGLIGTANGATVRNCYSLGTIMTTGDTQDIGGLIGRFNSSLISDSYSKVSITASPEAFRVGGLIGYLQGSSDNDVIINCYATGRITGGKGEIGGFIGSNPRETLIVNSYWNKETTGITVSAGGESLTTVEMTYPIGRVAYFAWDFDNVWNSSEEINNGYPHHKPQAPVGVLLTTKIYPTKAIRENILTWTIDRLAAGYRIYRDDKSIATVYSKEGIWIDSEVDISKMYHYNIRAIYLINDYEVESASSVERKTIPIRD